MAVECLTWQAQTVYLIEPLAGKSVCQTVYDHCVPRRLLDTLSVFFLSIFVMGTHPHANGKRLVMVLLNRGVGRPGW